MTKPFTTFASAAALAALITSAFAMGAKATEADANGDGLLTIDEVQAVWPEVTADDFAAMDANADGALDADEMKAAETAGLIKPTDG